MSTIIFGVNPVLEALKGNPRSIEKLFVAEGAVNQRVAGEIAELAKAAGLKIDRVDR
ncbi:MAG: 23S rRNA (guanosine(2251)-2'-O)-methyltransferase RlmB, partial [Archangium sp.]|nr:23S rRNA (guanosine(2251)-2'-O)-methyltransferase RlmB [Archangium sp.]